MDAVTIIDLAGDDYSTPVPYTTSAVSAPADSKEDDLELWLEHTRWYDAEHRTHVLEGIKKLKAIDKKRAAPEQEPVDEAVDWERTKALVAVEASGVSYSPVAAYTNSPCLRPHVADDSLPFSLPQNMDIAPRTPEHRGRTLNRDDTSHERDPSPLSLAWIMKTYPISPPSSPMRRRSQSPPAFSSPTPATYRSRSPTGNVGRGLYTARRTSPRLFTSRDWVGYMKNRGIVGQDRVD